VLLVRSATVASVLLLPSVLLGSAAPARADARLAHAKGADVARAAVPVVAAALPPAAAAAVVLADVLVTAVAMWCRCLGCKG